MKQKLSWIGLVVLVAGVLGSAIYTIAADGEYGLAEIKVNNLSCGACVSKIQSALGGVNGLGVVDVNITRGEARVEYDASKITPEAIAAKISAAGYPAELLREQSAGEYQAKRSDQAAMAQKYTGKIGDRLVSKEEFAALVEEFRPANKNFPESALKQAVWSDLIQQELLLSDASRNGIVVQNGEVDLAIQKMKEKMPDFDKKVAAQFGSLDKFHAYLKTQMVVEKNIEENVVKGVDDRNEQRQKLNQWYSGLVEKTPVAVYDPALKAAAGGGGCGNCASGGGCATKPQS